MFRATVAQNATTPVSEGMKNRKNSPKLWNFEGVASMGPKPPALLRAQSNSASPIKSRNGAVIPCRKRIVLMPRTITITLSSQKNRKQVGRPHVEFLHEGARATTIAKMASPPIHV